MFSSKTIAIPAAPTKGVVALSPKGNPFRLEGLMERQIESAEVFFLSGAHYPCFHETLIPNRLPSLLPVLISQDPSNRVVSTDRKMTGLHSVAQVGLKL